MGNDGGDIPKRKQLVKTKEKDQTPNMQSIAMGRSRFCNLTNQRMKQPLAIDRIGCIYNYENILQALTKKILPAKYAYIKKLSDIKKVKIERTTEDSLNFFMCPITKLEYNGFNKFYGIWSCGHVLSKKALKELETKDSQKTCVICEAPFQEKDLIDLNLQGNQLQIKRKIETEKKLMKKTKTKGAKKGQQQPSGEPSKKVKTQTAQYVNSIDRLGGQFRDVLRDRSKFKQIFSKDQGVEWKQNTYTSQLKPKQ